jgi:osmotically inducible lipoprotein OsmB
MGQLAAVLGASGTPSVAVTFVSAIFPFRRETMRKSLSLLVVAGALMALGACSTTTEQKAGAGAVAGAVVGGPIGAAVGGAAGAVAGHAQDDASKPHS